MSGSKNTAVHQMLAALSGRSAANTGDLLEIAHPTLLSNQPGPIDSPEVATYDGTILFPGSLAAGAHLTVPAAGGLSVLALRIPESEMQPIREGRPLAIHVPEVSRVVLTGTPERGEASVSGLDLGLAAAALLGERHTLGAIIEVTGDGLSHLSIEARSSLCAVAPLIGAVAVIISPDKRIVTEMRRHSDHRFDTATAGTGAEYASSVSIDLASDYLHVLTPEGAILRPASLRECIVDRVVVAGVGGAGYSHLAMLARLLRGREKHQQVALTVQPATPAAEERARQKGILDDLQRFGAKIIASSLTLPLVQAGDTALITGADVLLKARTATDSAVYLAGPAVAAAAAMSGAISPPGEALLPLPGDSKVSARKPAGVSGRASAVKSVRRKPAP